MSKTSTQPVKSVKVGTKPIQKRSVYNPNKDRRTLVTPEGVDLQLKIAEIGSRIGAFVLDIAIMVASLIALTYAIIYAGGFFGDNKGEMALVIWILIFFFLRNFYFTFFEMGPRGATPGKRLMKIRVASRSGGHLSAGSVFARNALRELEFFIPLMFVLSPKTGVEGWMTLAGLVWSFIFLLFPFFNKDRLRAGDLLAGSWVVKTPKPILSKDLAEAPTQAHARYPFTQKQIDAYGVKELHVLENILRKNDFKIIKEVTERIMQKIEWPDPEKTADNHTARREFLSAYYTALRGKLETKLLFGVRRKDKFDRR